MVGAVCRLQTPFRKKKKTLHLLNSKCSTWSDIRGTSMGSPLRSKEKWMLTGKLLWSWPWNRLWSAYCVTRLHKCMICACVRRVHCCGCRHGYCLAHWVVARLPLSSMLPPQPRSGTMLRRQVADTHQILAFHCCQETCLLTLYMRNPKPRKMKGLTPRAYDSSQVDWLQG